MWILKSNHTPWNTWNIPALPMSTYAPIAVIADNPPRQITFAPNAQTAQKPLPRTSHRPIAVIAHIRQLFPKPQIPSHFHYPIIGDTPSPIIPNRISRSTRNNRNNPDQAAPSISHQRSRSGPSHLSPKIKTNPANPIETTTCTTRLSAMTHRRYSQQRHPHPYAEPIFKNPAKCAKTLPPLCYL